MSQAQPANEDASAPGATSRDSALEAAHVVSDVDGIQTPLTFGIARHAGIELEGWATAEDGGERAARPLVLVRVREYGQGEARRVWPILLAIAILLGLVAPSPTRAASAPPRPRIVWKPIPFPAARKLEMQAYAKRHYGIDRWRLRNPRVIVEHYTDSDSLASAFATFSADVPDSELHELPGICAHFVVDRDGTIYQLVPLTVMCRHTVGLNWTAIGIEHVGTSDRQILHNRRQMASSLALAAWLMARYGVGLGDVIGHNESRTSRYHREQYRTWRCQTHSDWSVADMNAYRTRLRSVALRSGVPLGGSSRRVAPHCA